jgi:hypothetical protein
MNNLTTFAIDNQMTESMTTRVLLDEEAKQLILRRGREIKSGRMRLIPHEEVMSEMDALLREYEG